MPRNRSEPDEYRGSRMKNRLGARGIESDRETFRCILHNRLGCENEEVQKIPAVRRSSSSTSSPLARLTATKLGAAAVAVAVVISLTSVAVNADEVSELSGGGDRGDGDVVRASSHPPTEAAHSSDVDLFRRRSEQASGDTDSERGRIDDGGEGVPGPSVRRSQERRRTSPTSILQQLLQRNRMTKASQALLPVLPDDHVRRIQEGLKSLSHSLVSIRGPIAGQGTSITSSDLQQDSTNRQIQLQVPSSPSNNTIVISTRSGPGINSASFFSSSSSSPVGAAVIDLQSGGANTAEVRTIGSLGSLQLPNLASAPLLFPFRNPETFQQQQLAQVALEAQHMATVGGSHGAALVNSGGSIRPPAAILGMPALLQQQQSAGNTQQMLGNSGMTNSQQMMGSGGSGGSSMNDIIAPVVNVMPDASIMALSNAPDPEGAAQLISSTLSQLDDGTVAVYTCGGVGKERVTNFVNQNFPFFDAASGECSFTLTITNPHVCQVRVDFVQTELLGPSEGLCLDQFLEYAGDFWPPGVTRICGNNPDQHFYLELYESQTIRQIRFKVTTIKRETMYRYGLWITQINCNENVLLQAPPGCFQYFTETTGVIKSFNFEGSHLTFDQHYRVCIKGRPNGCQLVVDATDGNFGLKKEGGSPYDSGVGDMACSHSYLMVPGSSADGGSMRPTMDRFCGGKLSFSHGDIRSRPIVARFTSRVGFIEVHTGPRLPPYPPQVHLVGFNLSYNLRTICGG